ncbi:ribosome maturation factor RimM [Oceanobacillus caeni]|uniref:Ribosome maturation factor RimM n=1 Tax=Oceanobacillus caeni TaxID=405946 RepID=A0ABR5MLL7_9BACI|nr:MULTISPECIES: ribosome maturation factor RimM [Bacillaceae]KKE78350.1 16S rRNA processing protein RimM [Bacilli bacterium VT-13-104]PZD88694.1 ribosome maturation factor RimM [Bacilli bacterium]KPH77033.1 16S rRNA processing protein RimM [Oceanobacillus caeni]MBU8790115.1 ribosome maturation factor RimM [Oceanobacillus caeni]MCR1833274.1 ribosome maturation factor RimM [Oceanobacillus caeni]
MTINMFNVGKILNTHGIRGEVKVLRISDFDDRFQIGSTVYLDKKDGEPLELVIDGHRIHKGYDLLQFEGYHNINDVENFKGLYLKISEEQLTELDDNEFYYHEIIGCDVHTTDNQYIGKIKEILSPGANDVWVVKQPKGKDILVPYIKEVVKSVDIEEKNVRIELMEGLLD